ncbi:hypothetical protein C7H19_24065 [Aphanothece hegewaldii CCALA 016]|uniref:Uncharacterized protein n=1 Tax=Aphanothece hegewaldii CCALA 016 TaxID=2107694 RepID=A0A2T1LQV1_9CHRO|nr:hypothetical protein [Aphanothece hegewaldii]PSF30031.1 hypothetical protein C7H19_24065 [Aphanothece hegewaldii CCALA 016]
MPSTLYISGQILGKTKPLFSEWCLPLPQTLTSITLRELLTQVVLAEVEAFRTRSEERRLIKTLSPSEIRTGVEKGKIDMGGRDIVQTVDPQEAVDTVLQAFEDGFYFVFVDEQQQETLDSIVSLKTDSQLMFLRLVPLVGG